MGPEEISYLLARMMHVEKAIHSSAYVMDSAVLYWAGATYPRQYRDLLRAGWSGDRIPMGARFSETVQTGSGAHPASCTMCTGSFPGVKSGRGVTLTPHPLLVPLS
jgi:hypothetical protein